MYLKPVPIIIFPVDHSQLLNKHFQGLNDLYTLSKHRTPNPVVCGRGMTSIVHGGAGGALVQGQHTSGRVA